MVKILFVGIVLIGLSGCSSVSEIDNGKTSYAYQVTDRDCVALDEIVVGSQVSGKDMVNVHIVLTAILNASVPKTDEFKSSSYYDSDVRRIVQGAYPRISAEIVDYVLKLGTPDFLRIKEQSPQIAMNVFKPVFGKWKYAYQYKVEFIVTSIYCTDGSVGRSANGRTMPWW